MHFLHHTWVLLQKDLLVLLRRRWLSTTIRALIFPVIFTLILSEISNWLLGSGHNGVGPSRPVLDFSAALKNTGGLRPKVVIVDNGFDGGDVGTVVDQLSSTIKASGKQLHVLRDNSEIADICPTSNSGVSDCYGAVEFLSSPDHGPTPTWNYSLYGDRVLGSAVSVDSDNNDIQFLHLSLPACYRIGHRFDPRR